MSDLERVNRAFLPIAQPVEHFATAHALHLDRCARGNAGWELTGAHHCGGTFYLLLLYDEKLGLGVSSVWQFPSIEMSLVYSHFRPVRPCPLEAADVTAALDCELKTISQVPFGYWTHLRPLHHPGTSVAAGETSE